MFLCMYGMSPALTKVCVTRKSLQNKLSFCNRDEGADALTSFIHVLCTTSSCFVVVYKSSGNVHRLHTQIALFYTLNGECKKDKSLPVKLLLLHSCFYQHGTFREMEVKVSK